jgi:hypothetical protein
MHEGTLHISNLKKEKMKYVSVTPKMLSALELLAKGRSRINIAIAIDVPFHWCANSLNKITPQIAALMIEQHKTQTQLANAGFAIKI